MHILHTCNPLPGFLVNICMKEMYTCCLTVHFYHVLSMYAGFVRKLTQEIAIILVSVKFIL
jgi:hypothetical protein